MKAWSCLFSYVTMSDNATCREIEVVAKDGNQAISLGMASITMNKGVFDKITWERLV